MNMRERYVADEAVDKTLSKGLRLVELLGTTGRGGVSELAVKTGLTRSNVHRLLQTLCRIGWVQKVEQDSSYELSYKTWEVAQNWIARLDLPRIAGPHLASLAADTRETVHMGVLRGEDVVFISTIDTPLAVRTYTPLGSRAPAHCVATGKVLLAWLPADQRPQLPESLYKYSEQSIGTRAELEVDLDRSRERGYAINRSEWQSGVNGIAAPVFAGSGQSVIAAVGLSVPAERLNRVAMRKLAPRVIEAAQAISAAVAVATGKLV